MTDHSPAPGAAGSAAEIATPNAGRYLRQLCRHFAHKRPVTFDERSGSISLFDGDCRLEALDDSLKLELSVSDGGDLARLQDVVARHLLRFAFREDMRIDWHPV